MKLRILFSLTLFACAINNSIHTSNHKTWSNTLWGTGKTVLASILIPAGIFGTQQFAIEAISNENAELEDKITGSLFYGASALSMGYLWHRGLKDIKKSFGDDKKYRAYITQACATALGIGLGFVSLNAIRNIESL